MGTKVLVHNDLIAFLILTIHFSVVTGDFVDLHVFPLHLDMTAFLKETLAIVGTLNNLKRTVYIHVSFNVPPFNNIATLVLAGDLRLGTLVLDVFLHVIQGQHQPAVQKALHYPEWTQLHLVFLQVSSDDFPANFIVRTHYRSEAASFQVFLNFPSPNDFFAFFIQAVD